MNQQGGRLKAVRHALGLTQKQMADALGVSKGSVSQIELGIYDASRQSKLLELIFGVNGHWLKTGEGNMFLDRRNLLRQAFEKQWQMPSDEATFIADLITAPPEQRRQLIKAIEAFKSLGQ